ncbi:kinase-like protein [Marasmius fiardii PR-910]|nr:kinase-like protein [Marasmius fiardii PR-910]
MLVKQYHIFPSSFFCNDVRREGDFPLAHGGFADVYKGFMGDQTVCLKVLRVYTQTEEKERKKRVEDFCKEALIWTQLSHPNVLQLLGVNTELFNADFCLVSPWMANGDLITFLKTTPHHDKLRSIREIVAGLEYLHSRSPMVVHGDIKGANILVDDNCNCRLADFGLAREASGTSIIEMSSGGMKGSVPWMAPELFQPPSTTDSNEQRSPSRDIYAYACTIFEIMTGRPPFSHVKHIGAIIAQVSLHQARPVRPTGVWCPDNVWQLVEKCWDQDRLKRPTAIYVYNYLTGLNTLRNFDNLRSFLFSSASLKILQEGLEITESCPASSIIEWLQKSSTASHDGLYRKRCRKCLNMLVKKHHVFPSSFFCNDVRRRGGDHPLGGGGFADIYKGTVGNQMVSLKVLRIHTQPDEAKRKQMIEGFCKEALIWTQLDHPNVVQLLGVNTTLFETRFCLVSPWMDNSNIITFLKMTPGHDRLRSLREIAAGLEYLHSRSPMVVHGDIKGANILVDEDYNCRLADFGLSKEAPETGASIIQTSTGQMGGTLRWMAPEMLLVSSPTNPTEDRSPTDIYAYAYTIIEIMTLRLPFPKLSDVSVVIKVLKGARPDRPTGVWCPDNVWQLVERCWDQDWLKRPTATYVLNYLTGLDKPGTAGRSDSPDISSRVTRHETSIPISVPTISQLSFIQTNATSSTMIPQSTKYYTALTQIPQTVEATEAQDTIAHDSDQESTQYFTAPTRDFRAIETIKLRREVCDATLDPEQEQCSKRNEP